MHVRILGVELYNRPPSIDVPPIDDNTDFWHSLNRSRVGRRSGQWNEQTI